MTAGWIYLSLDAGIVTSNANLRGSQAGSRFAMGSVGATVYSRLFNLPTSSALLGVGGLYSMPLTKGSEGDVAGVVSLIIGLYGGDNFLSIIPGVTISEHTTTASLTLTYSFVKRPKEPMF